MLATLEAFQPLFVNCGIRFRNFHSLAYGKKRVRKIVINQRIEPLLSNKIFIISKLNHF